MVLTKSVALGHLKLGSLKAWSCYFKRIKMRRVVALKKGNLVSLSSDENGVQLKNHIIFLLKE